MLTVRSRENLASFAAANGLHVGDALNVILEVIVPKMQPDRVRDVLADSNLQWLRLEVSERVTVELQAGEEGAFRARVARYRRNTGRVVVVNKIGPTTVEVSRHADLPAPASLDPSED